jgi:hypothetical protein
VINVYTASMTFDHAEADCVSKGGHLASLHSAEDFAELHDAAERAGVRDAIFVGGFEDGGNDHWAWTDGTT